MTTALPVTTVATLLQATIALLHAEVTALPTAVTRWRPAPDAWCINEVLGHLIEAEQQGFAGRIRQILAADNPICQTWHPDQVAAARHDQEKSALVLWQELATARAASIQLLETLDSAQLARQGQHPNVGALCVQDLLHEWIYHDRNHIKQILSNVQASVWPSMGNAQRFESLA